jgi:transcriptional regulator with XRE-family HTH domain
MEMSLKSQSLPIDIEVGKTIASLRRAQGLSQTTLSEALGVTFQQVQKYEKGTNRVSVSALVRICKALGVGPMDIIGRHFGNDEPSPASKLASEVVDLKRKLSEIKTLAA